MNKLYCATIFSDRKDIVDVIHIVASSNAEVHKEMDQFIQSCKAEGFGDEYNSYSFHVVEEVDGYSIEVLKSNKNNLTTNQL